MKQLSAHQGLSCSGVFFLALAERIAFIQIAFPGLWLRVDLRINRIAMLLGGGFFFRFFKGDQGLLEL